MQTIARSSESSLHGGGENARRQSAHWNLAGGTRLDACGLSVCGLVRLANEDDFILANVAPAADTGRAARGAIPLLAVADGAGGHAGGALAGRLAVRTALKEAARRGQAGEWSPQRRSTSVEASLAAAVQTCQAVIVRCGARNATLSKMATTLTMGVIRGPVLHLAHVGDSRCYLQRGARVTQLTADHTVARMLEREGFAASSTGAFRHVLSNALAANHDGVSVDTRTVELEVGDTLLFCSDGLSNALASEAMAATLAAAPSVTAAARALVRRALDVDGSDNVTVIVARAESGDA